MRIVIRQGDKPTYASAHFYGPEQYGQIIFHRLTQYLTDTRIITIALQDDDSNDIETINIRDNGGANQLLPMLLQNFLNHHKPVSTGEGPVNPG